MPVYGPPISGAAQTALNTKAPLPSNVINPLTGFIHLSGFTGYDNTGTTSNTAALNAAITLALASNVGTVISGSAAPRLPTIVVGAGIFLFDAATSFDLKPATSGSNSDRGLLTIRGAGPLSTIFQCDQAVTGTVFKFYGGSLHVEGIQFRGKGTFAGTMMEVGSTATTSGYINQFSFNDVHFVRGGAGCTFLKLTWCFDGQFNNVHFREMILGGIMVDVPANTTDNNNNLIWNRCHWEQGVGATFLRVRSDFSSTGTHATWDFINCHMESRSWNTRAIDAEGISRWNFVGGSFPHSNSADGAAAGIVAADTVNYFRFVNADSITFSNVGITRQGGPQAFPKKLVAIGGVVRSLLFETTWFSPSTTGFGNSTSSIWEEDATTALTTKGIGSPQFINCLCSGDRAQTEVSPNQIVVQDAASTSAWSTRIDPTSKALIYGNGNTGTDITTGRTDRMNIDAGGGLNLLTGPVRGKQVVIADATSAAFSFSFPSGVNSNKRGIYLIQADSSDSTHWALAASTGAALASIAAGAGMVVATADAGTASKFSVFVASNVLTVYNRTGTSRTVTVTMFSV